MCHASKYGTPFKHTQSANVSIEAFKIVSRIGFNKTAARCAAIKNKEKLLERLDRPILDLRGYPLRFRKHQYRNVYMTNALSFNPSK